VPNTPVKDDDLLAAARAGAPEAIEALLERYQERVFGFGLRMCGDREDAEDVLQDTLLAAAEGMKHFRGGSSLSTWLYTIARSFCIKKRRRSKFAPVEEVSLDGMKTTLPSPAASPDELASRREVRRALTAALESLDPESREVLILRDMEGLTAPEVATVTGASVDAVKSRLHRARLAIRAHLEKALAEAPRASGRDCPDVLTALSHELEGDLDPEICATLQRHLDACPSCRGACDSLKQTLAICARLPAGPVPAAVKDSVRAALRAALATRS
jgi:RNA polymerase sigma-70 factor (ECF subfamily)